MDITKLVKRGQNKVIKTGSKCSMNFDIDDFVTLYYNTCCYDVTIGEKLKIIEKSNGYYFIEGKTRLRHVLTLYGKNNVFVSNRKDDMSIKLLTDYQTRNIKQISLVSKYCIKDSLLCLEVFLITSCHF